jgi:hypothetical protein
MYWAFFPGDWRKLKNLILALLKSELASEVRKINYVKTYKLVDWKIDKQESKLLLIVWNDNKQKIEALIKKQYSDLDIKLFDCNIWVSD